MDRKLRIALGDLSYLNQGNAHNLYVPINIGYIASYARKRFGQEIDVRLYKDPHKLIREAEDWQPDLVGLSLYYWNHEMDRATVRALHRRVQGVAIVAGGPSIDTDMDARMELQARMPGVHALIPNEGEEGFARVIEWVMKGRPEAPAIGTGLSTDLAEVPSPYLDGTLDEFLTGPYQPMIQTSRLCPYTCSFCVSGKNRGKLRAFPMQQVEEEITFIGEVFRDRPDHMLYITDENFGILDRDVTVARMIHASREFTGFPRKLFYYNDKRFTQRSRDVHEIVGDMCHHGVTLSLQSENPETLKAIKRRNLTDAEIKSAIQWAHTIGLKASTELIFGLPMETRESFYGLLDKVARLGFDAIQCYNLIIFDGIEMNRRAYRDQHAVETRPRFIHNHGDVIDGTAVREHEDIVVSSSSFTREDYAAVRRLNILFHAIFVLGVGRDRMRALVKAGASLTRVLEHVMHSGGYEDAMLREREPFMRDLTLAIDKEISGHDNDQVKLQWIFANRLAKEEWFVRALEGIDVIADEGAEASTQASAVG